MNLHTATCPFVAPVRRALGTYPTNDATNALTPSRILFRAS